MNDFAHRERPHAEAIRGAVRALEARGIAVQELPVDGHNPDLQLDGGDLIEVKTSDKYRNLAVELDSFSAWDVLHAQGKRVLIVHRDKQKRWWVDTPWSLRSRIIGGPHRATGNGSPDPWHRIAPGGTPIEEWFGPRPQAKAS